MKTRTFAYILLTLTLCQTAWASEPAPFSEADMLPVRSILLSPGDVANRALDAPGLSPLFLIGDDPRSRRWLQQRYPMLQDLNAVGLVVNVDTPTALDNLRQLAPALTMSPVSADDLAQRLELKHYPVLITAEAVEQ